MENIADKQAGKMTGSLHPSLQFLIFVGVFIGAFFVGSLLGGGLVIALYGLKTITAVAQLDITAPHFIPATWILQLLSTTLPILATAILFARFVVNDTADYLRNNFKFSWLLMVASYLAHFK